MKLIFVGLLSFVFNQVLSLTTSEVTKIKRKLNKSIKGQSIPTAVRLSFHDCTGGCDGCINLNNADNNGLSDIISTLETVYSDNSYSDIISRADLWALAGVVAVEKAVELNNCNQGFCTASDCTGEGCVPEPGFVFQWGRKDCETAPYALEDVNVGLPGPTFNHDEVLDFFATEFSLTARETTALMGAHSLGRTQTANSGFNGVWTAGEANFFNNRYYQLLVDSSISWKHRDNTKDTKDTDGSHWQWNAKETGFMLTADVSLYKDITVDSDGKSTCTTMSDCPRADDDTAAVVEEFAASNQVWVPEFVEAFTKMLANGSNLQDLTS